MIMTMVMTMTTTTTTMITITITMIMMTMMPVSILRADSVSAFGTAPTGIGHRYRVEPTETTFTSSLPFSANRLWHREQQHQQYQQYQQQKRQPRQNTGLRNAADGYRYDSDRYDDYDQTRNQHYQNPNQQRRNNNYDYNSNNYDYNNNNNYNHDNYNNPGHDYRLEPHSVPGILPDCRFTEEQIHVLIAKRSACKKRRAFADADKILAALNANGIHLQDKARRYRTDGANHFGGKRKPPYVRRGSTLGMEAGDLDEIARLVEQRDRCKRQRDFVRSDDIAETLKHRFGVRINDKKREWRLVTHTNDNDNNNDNNNGNDNNNDNKSDTDPELYVPTPLAPPDHPTHNLNDSLLHHIRSRLRDRSIARARRDYTEADRIRDELLHDHSVLIDDRTLEFRVVADWDDEEERNDPFVVEAQLSQRSAFVQTRGRQSQEPKQQHQQHHHQQQQQQQHPPHWNGGEREHKDEHKDEHKHEHKDEHKHEHGNQNLSLDNPSKDDSHPSETKSSVSVSVPVSKDDEPETVATVVARTQAKTETKTETKTEPSLDRLSALTVVALKEKLRAEGLRVGGNKAELIDRLASAGILE